MIPFHKNTLEGIDFPINRLGPAAFEDNKAKCNSWFKNNYKLQSFYFTKSCTQSLELAVLSLNLPAGSEIIIPSYAFVSLANAVNNLGLKCVFVDCEEHTMNLDAKSMEQAISPKTKAVITINYGGVACDYDTLGTICKKHNLFLIEDNAHGIKAKYKGGLLGSFGDISAFCFDNLKNINCYEGGGMNINNQDLTADFDICYEFGTNKAEFLSGKSSFYEWRGKGSNCRLPAPLFPYLAAQLEVCDDIISAFTRKWELYQEQLEPLESKGYLKRAKIPDYATHNGHMFWFKTANIAERNKLMDFLKKREIQTTFHYTPLHKSGYGSRVGEFRGEDRNTTKESERLLRLPLFYTLTEDQLHTVVQAVNDFYAA